MAPGSYLSSIAGVQLLESFPFSAQGQRALLMTPATGKQVKRVDRELLGHSC
jgi:hypothetical protein